MCLESVIVHYFGGKERKSQGNGHDTRCSTLNTISMHTVEAMRSFIGDGPETKVFWDALDFAFEAHGSQWRRSGDPYIMHPCSVARILAEELDIRNPEILAAALLHDTVEDVEEVTGEVIRKKFGANVEAIVEGCTKVTHYTGDRQTFKKLVHRKIFSGAAAKLEVMIVKLADRLHNLRTLSSMPKHKRQKISDETLDIYAPLATILGLFAIKRELYNLALAYKFPRQGSRLQMHINSLREDPVVLAIIDNVQQAMTQEGLEGKVALRTKGLWGYFDVRNRILIKEIESPQEILILMHSRKRLLPGPRGAQPDLSAHSPDHPRFHRQSQALGLPGAARPAQSSTAASIFSRSGPRRWPAAPSAAWSATGAGTAR